MKEVTTPQQLKLLIELYFSDIEIDVKEVEEYFCFIASVVYRFSYVSIGKALGVCECTPPLKKRKLDKKLRLNKGSEYSTIKEIVKFASPSLVFSLY